MSSKYPVFPVHVNDVRIVSVNVLLAWTMYAKWQ